MKAKLYAVADKYDVKGWAYRLVCEDKWDPYENVQEQARQAVLLDTIDLPLPGPKDVVKICGEAVEAMQEDLNEHVATVTRNIKEYESKFLLLTNEESAE